MEKISLHKLDPNSDREEPQNFSVYEEVDIKPLNMRVIQLELCNNLQESHEWQILEKLNLIHAVVNKRKQLIDEFLK